MKTRPITQEYLIQRLIRVIERLDDPEYKITKLDYVILNVSFLRLRYDKYTMSKPNFSSLVSCYRSARPIVDDFMVNQIRLFKIGLKNEAVRNSRVNS